MITVGVMFKAVYPLPFCPSNPAHIRVRARAEVRVAVLSLGLG